ncbi:MAG: hypothetical protein R2828_25235 [Saprospiraceae bacterium]
MAIKIKMKIRRRCIQLTPPLLRDFQLTTYNLLCSFHATKNLQYLHPSITSTSK